MARGSPRGEASEGGKVTVSGLRFNLNGTHYIQNGEGSSNRKHRGCANMGEGSTAYAGPVITSRHVVGGHPFALVRPGDPDRLLDDPSVLAWNHRDDYMPYWAYLWPGAFLLAEVVAKAQWEPGTPALEIGCGL